MKRIIFFIIRQLLKILWIFPIKKNKITIKNLQNDYTCNSKYIAKYIIENNIKTFKIIYLVKSDKEDTNTEYVTFIKCNSIKALYHTITSKVIMMNTGLSQYIPYRKSQFLLNTWHGGGAYKRVGKDIYKFSKYIRWLNSTRCNLYLSSCEAFTKFNVRNAFEYNGEVLNSGLPRNDLFFRKYNIDFANQIKKKLGITLDLKILLYAPTVRCDSSLGNEQLNYRELISALSQKFGGTWIILYRSHFFMKSSEFCNDVMDVTDYSDMQELLYIADVLITDYSSCIWDFSFTYKPCFLYANDLASYKQERDFYISIYEWPFLLAQTNAELMSNIKKYDANAYKKRVDEHHNNLKSYEKGNACQQVIKKLSEICYEV